MPCVGTPRRSMRLPSPTSSEDEVASSQTSHSHTDAVVQTIVKGRKSWKASRGGELVWPPELEAALVEGLENYQPDDSRETRMLGRFPLRNKFISDWIYEKTGRRRTAKQVGSRLQQLRDTCHGGKKISNLVSQRPRGQSRAAGSRSAHRPTPSTSGSEFGPEDGSDSTSDSSAPSTPTEAHATLKTLLWHGIGSNAPTEGAPNSVVYIDLLQTSPSIADKTSHAEDERRWTERGMSVIRLHPTPRCLSEIDPTITFISPTPISATSIFSIYVDDSLAFTEEAPVQSSGMLSNSPSEYLYSTPLAPEFWPDVCRVDDLSRHTIVHRVVRDQDGVGQASVGKSRTLFCTMYRFRYNQPCLTMLSPFSVDHDLSMASSASELSFETESILSLSSSDSSCYDDSQGFYDSSPWTHPTDLNVYHH